MGVRLSDPLPPRRYPCWGASIVESMRGTHLAEPGERYCAKCKAKNAAVGRAAQGAAVVIWFALALCAVLAVFAMRGGR